jgi:O-antigen/teichoic acid export membrane protein
MVVAGGGLIAQVLMTVSGIFMARMLGVEGRGQVVLITSLAAMASQLTIGGSLANAVTRTLASHQVRARDGLRRLVPTWLVVGTSAGMIAGGYFFFLHRAEPTAVTTFLALTVLISAVNAMTFRIIIAALLGESAKPAKVAFVLLFPLTMTTVLVAVGYAVDRSWSAVGVMILVLASQSLSLVISLTLFARPTRDPAHVLQGTEFYQVARRQYFGNLGPVDGLALDRTMIGSLLGNAALGIYSAAGALAMLAPAMGAGLAQVLLPLATARQGHVEDERALIRRSLLVGGGILAALVLGIELIAAPVIHAAFGPAFMPAVEPARWLIPATGLLGFRRILVAVLQARDRAGRASVVELALCVVMVAGIVVAAQTGNITHVAITMLVVGVVACAALGVLVWRSGRSAPVSASAHPSLEADAAGTPNGLPG